MTNLEIFATIISEASGRPIDEVKKNTNLINKICGNTGNLYKEVPDAEAQVLLEKLRKELPGIANWLIEGAAKSASKNR